MMARMGPAVQEADAREATRAAFMAAQGVGNAVVTAVPGDASFRRYYRLDDGARKLIVMDAPPPKEDVRPFVNVQQILEKMGHSAPKVIGADEAQGFLLLEDLGDGLFARLLKQDAGLEMPLYAAAVDVLADVAGKIRRNPGVPEYDDALMLKEAMLFVEWYLPCMIGERAASLAEAYANVWGPLFAVARQCPSTLVLRDYHAENLMWLPQREAHARVGLLDFQDAVFGPVVYDLVSLLEDARRDVQPATVAAMKDRFFARIGGGRDGLEAAYAAMGLQRNMKIVGIFTRLWRRDGKPGYLKLLPRVWRHVEADLRHPACAPMREWLDAHVPPELRKPPETA